MYRGRRFLTPDAKATKEAIAWEVATQYKQELMTMDIKLNIRFYVKNTRIDIDNYLKGLLDCLTGLIWTDDRFITEIHVYKIIDKNNPRVEIDII
jgi:Holliday junction resolvase RusA-like endonuclease